MGYKYIGDGGAATVICEIDEKRIALYFLEYSSE